MSLLGASAVNLQLVSSRSHFLETKAASEWLIFISLFCATTLRKPVSVPTLFAASVQTCAAQPFTAARLHLLPQSQVLLHPSTFPETL